MRQILELRNAGVWPAAGGVGYFTAGFVDKDSFTEGMPWSRPTGATEGKCTSAQDRCASTCPAGIVVPPRLQRESE